MRKLKIYILALISTMICFGCNSQINKDQRANNQSEQQEVKHKTDSSKYNQFENGFKIGVWREYYENGNLKSESNYINGIKEGNCKEWWQNGKLWTEVNYSNDKANGYAKWYHENGYLAGEGMIDNGKRNGLWKVYDYENGKLAATGEFKNDEKNKNWTLFHENGNKSKEQFWEIGTLISENCWDNSGEKIDCK